MNKWTRRAFIGTGSLVGGGFVLGVAGLALAPSRHSVVSDDAADTGQLTTWITVTPDNIVTILVPHCEMGQGTQTALAMMAAEEMNADWALVRVKEAPALDAYANAYIVHAFAGEVPSPFVRGFDYGTYRLARWFGTQITGGSLSVRTTGVYGMTVAGAAARDMLIAAGAARFGVSPKDCNALNSRIVHTASGKSASFGELAKAAATIRVPTLYTVGEFDEADPPTIRHFAELTPGARVAVLAGAAHLTPWDAPDDNLHMVRAFLRSADSAAARH